MENAKLKEDADTYVCFSETDILVNIGLLTTMTANYCYWKILQ